ncbi:MAG: hypothetical protein HYV90_05315 [Candidatus Woesebacteria bacterium]|nr:MAG: hypothetical protein HYV90_05315 [Candidatus Woesebacteria bacterium]
MAEGGDNDSKFMNAADLQNFWAEKDVETASTAPINIGKAQERVVAGQKTAVANPTGLEEVTANAAKVAKEQRKTT